MKTFSAALLMASATSVAAFTPSTGKASSSTTLSAGMPDRKWSEMVDPTQRSASCPWLPRAINLDGTAPGDYGFDPFYLSSIPKNFAGAIQPPSWEDVGEGIPTFYWMREAELKNGRVAMMAVAGWIATDLGMRFPGAGEPFISIPSSYLAHDTLVEQGTMGFMLLAIGFVELCSSAVLVQVSKGEIEREPGDYEFGKAYLAGRSDEEIFKIKTQEVNNARLAMLAFGGIATQTALGYESFPYF